MSSVILSKGNGCDFKLMKTFSIAFLLLTLSAASVEAQDSVHAHVGAQQHGSAAAGDGHIKRGAPVGDAERVKLSEVLKEPRAYEGKRVVIEGTVTRVCKSRGCWAEIVPDGSGDESLRVVFGNHTFFIPKDSERMRFRAEGEFSLKTLSKEEVEHLIKDDGAKLKVNADGTADELSFVATGVELWK